MFFHRSISYHCYNVHQMVWDCVSYLAMMHFVQSITVRQLFFNFVNSKYLYFHFYCGCIQGHVWCKKKCLNKYGRGRCCVFFIVLWYFGRRFLLCQVLDKLTFHHFSRLYLGIQTFSSISGDYMHQWKYHGLRNLPCK